MELTITPCLFGELYGLLSRRTDPKGVRPSWFAEIGRLGGKATGHKGFAAMPPERVSEISAKALAVRRKRAAKRFQ